MTLADVRPGQKLNIQILQEANRNAIKGEGCTQYPSRVFEVLKNGVLELEMPTREGKLVMLPMNIRYEFIFFVESGMYKAQGTITDRFKRQNFFLVHAKITSEFVKYQRRQFYRLNCMIPVAFQGMDDRVETMELMTDILDFSKSEDAVKYPSARGDAMDISGGGMRMVSDTCTPEANFFLLQFYIDIQGKRSMVELIAKKIAMDKLEDSNKYSYRFKFIFKDSKLQEDIIRFIFEEERRLRKKEQG